MSTDCKCFESGQGTLSKPLGTDETKGRYADVSLDRCLSCGSLWLRYFVEYEGFSRSGRWAMGLISDDAADTMTPDRAADYLAGLEWCIVGGSYFGHAGKRRSGDIKWDM